jgi:hypothetical protein
MVNQQKIITMTKLALYDKHEGAADRDANDYFRHDYIYRKNLGTRISVGVAGFFVLAIYWMRVLFMDGVDVFELDIQAHVTEAILFIVALAAVYSLIGTIQGTREYYLVQKRLDKYQELMRFLEEGEKKPTPIPEEIEKEPSPRTPRTRENREPRDPLANVSSRALSSTRPRTTPASRRPTPRPTTNPQPRVRLSSSPKDSPLVIRPPSEK